MPFTIKLIFSMHVKNGNASSRWRLQQCQEKGRTIFISSPKGKNWFYNKYKSIEKNENGFVLNAPSSDNPENTPDKAPAVRFTESFIFRKPVTFLVGENGAGKSTCWKR